MGSKEFACLKCTLPICDDRSAACLYRLGKPDRSDYYKAYYKANRLKKLVASMERNHNNREAYLEYQREYKQRKKERECTI